jgi:hypothetical protein
LEKFNTFSITQCFKVLKINYGTIPAFWRPRQGSNGINSAAVYAGISLPPGAKKANFVDGINEKKSSLTLYLKVIG